MPKDPEIRARETLLFSTAARYGPDLKDYILDKMREQDVTPPARRIVDLILGEEVPQATSAERDMAWHFAQNLPVETRLMKKSSLHEKQSVYRTPNGFADSIEIE